VVSISNIIPSTLLSAIAAAFLPAIKKNRIF